MPRRRQNAPGPAPEVIAPMQRQRNPRPRRRAVPRHPGIYYRPRPDGKIAAPYELRYLDSSGTYRWEIVHGSLEDAEAKRTQLRVRKQQGARIEPTRQTFEQYARAWLERQKSPKHNEAAPASRSAASSPESKRRRSSGPRKRRCCAVE